MLEVVFYMKIYSYEKSRLIVSALLILFLLVPVAGFSQVGEETAQKEEMGRHNSKSTEEKTIASKSSDNEGTSSNQAIIILAIIFVVVCGAVFLILREESHTC